MSGSASLLVGVAVTVGAMIAVQSQMLGVLEQRLGALSAAVAALIIGGIVGALLLLVLRPDLSAWRAVPGWAWVAGAAGFVVVLGISYAVPRLGITPTLSIVIAAQLVVGVILEQTGWLEASARPLDLLRVVGLVLVGTGAWLVVR